jgi:hypothetical protein
MFAGGAAEPSLSDRRGGAAAHRLHGASPRPRRAPKHRLTSPPPGFSAALKLVRIDDLIPRDAEVGLTYTYARRILDLLLNTSDGQAVAKELERAADTLFPALDHSAVKAIASMSGFQVGFGVCWLLMTRLGGGAR